MRLMGTVFEGTQAVPHVAQILPVPDVACGSARLFEVRAHFAGPKSPLQLGPRWQHRRHAIATNILFCAVRKMFCSCAAPAQKLCIMAAVPHASKTRPGFLTCVTLPTQAFPAHQLRWCAEVQCHCESNCSITKKHLTDLYRELSRQHRLETFQKHLDDMRNSLRLAEYGFECHIGQYLSTCLLHEHCTHSSLSITHGLEYTTGPSPRHEP